jgi:PAS domain S-box-containing protein
MVFLVLNRSAQARGLCRELQSSEKLYRTTIDAMSDAIHLVDSDLKITMISGTFMEWCERLGFNEDIIGQPIDRVCPFLNAEAIKEYRRVFREGEIIVTEDVQEFGGQTIITETQKIPVVESGRVKRVVTAIRDISERKRQEKILRLTQFSVDVNADAAFWIREDGSFSYVNQVACESLGYTKEELLGLSIYDIDENLSPEEWATHWQKIEQWRSFKIESTFRARDGRLFPVEVTANYLEFEGKKYNCAFARDISELKRINGALEKNLLRYDRIIKHIKVGVAVISSKMEIEFMNDTMYQWFSHINVSKRPKCCELFGEKTGTIECAECEAHRALQNGRDHTELRRIEAHSNSRTIRLRATAIRNDQNEIIAFVVSGEDIGVPVSTGERHQTFNT